MHRISSKVSSYTCLSETCSLAPTSKRGGCAHSY
jgi:hypothetical protein